MKKWKKLLAITAMVTMVFALAACGNDDVSADPTETPNPTEAPADPTEAPAADPTEAPAADPTEAPAADPTEAPAADPTEAPAADPTQAPVADPTEAPVADPTQAPAADPTEAPAADPTQAPVADGLVINFADLTHGGYGYEATVADGAVDVTIAGQYQEIQYVLPEAVDLAQYSKLVIDVISNNQLDIKLVNPDAAVNEYNQLTPFKDNYTAEGTAIDAPVEIDLAEFAAYDLSQINFMAMVNDTVFTIKNITFVKGDASEPVAPAEPTVEPTPEPTPEPTQAPAADEKTINFADLAHGGYGYEANVADGSVEVSIATTYQEIQYVLPEVVDLAQYSTMVVDVVSNGTLDIKLVNPDAAANEWNQLTPFADNYTAETITEPVYVALADYADYDLSQINFMSCVDNVTFTLKSVTFVK